MFSGCSKTSNIGTHGPVDLSNLTSWKPSGWYIKTLSTCAAFMKLAINNRRSGTCSFFIMFLFFPYDWLLDRILIHMKYFVTSYPVEIEGARSFAWCISLVPSREQRKIRKNPEPSKSNGSLYLWNVYIYIYEWYAFWCQMCCQTESSQRLLHRIDSNVASEMKYSHKKKKKKNNMELQNEGLVDDARKSSMCSLCHLKQCFSTQLKGSVTGAPGSLMKITGYPPMPCYGQWRDRPPKKTYHFWDLWRLTFGIFTISNL